MADHHLNPPGSSADHPLIAHQVNLLARELPADLVDELADGLHQTYRHHLSHTGDPDLAATAAVTEFGDAPTVTRAFTEQSPGRRTAQTLLVTGPLVGACWAAAFITGRAWTWPVPGPARLAVATALILTIAVIARLALGRVRYRPLHRAAAAASALVLTIDITMIVLVITVAPTITAPLGLACALSASRLALTGRRLPTLLRA
jgi:hypothetical protein